MRRTLLVLLAAALVAAGVAFVRRGRVAGWLMERTLRRNLASSRLDELPDGLHVGLCGAGSPLPDPRRSGPCVAVVAGRRLFVVDAGSGAARVLARMRLPPGRLEAVFLTHFHSDHIDGLGELLLQAWAGSGRTEPVPVYGPPGVERVVEGFRRAYSLDAGYRVAHHGPRVMPPGGAGGRAQPFATPEAGSPVSVLEGGGLRVTAFRVDHAPVAPAVGYRFDYAGRSVVVSGDTRRSAEVERLAKGADVLVHEALAPALVARIERAARAAGRSRLAQITEDILTYHTTPVEAAEIAQAARVRWLLLYHIVPPLPLSALEPAFLEGVAAAYDGPVTLGRDGTLLVLPAGSDAIEEEELL